MTTQQLRLRDRLRSPEIIRLIGAHDALSARIAERVGFDGVWASGLEIAASQGVPDAGVLSMPDYLAVAASMAAAVDIPIVADCDDGFGNAVNVMHTVRRYEAAGVAAVCIEDKVFPKVNSLDDKRQGLASVAEFVGKIEAATHARCSDEFVVIARVEALIVGAGQREALARAHAYAEAGADALLIHDKSPTPEAIAAFCHAWRGSVPLVVVPTTYYSVTVSELAALGVRMVIYANHGLRARVQATQQVFAAILQDGTTENVETSIAPLSHIFDLQRCAEYDRNEQMYVRSSVCHCDRGVEEVGAQPGRPASHPSRAAEMPRARTERSEGLPSAERAHSVGLPC